MTGEEDRIRTIAGYLLKNNARLILTAAPEAFNDESIMIRNAAGQDVVAFLGPLEPRNWPECLQQLMNPLDSTDFGPPGGRIQYSREGMRELPSKNGRRNQRHLPPRLYDPKVSHARRASLRKGAIACLSSFIPVGAQSLFVHVDTFIATLFKLTSDDDPLSCPRWLMWQAEYMLYSTKDKNENVALKTCEFCLTFAEDADLAVHLHPLLGKVAPVLLDCMIYGEDDLLCLEGDTEDAAVPDKDTDIKPRHYGGGKSHELERPCERRHRQSRRGAQNCASAHTPRRRTIQTRRTITI
ncbi:armadillo-type protein [Mycena metata]|uniref:Armadillo-type protein n=1 Tax=Mycena metata TaxID=1033252 RepID=A0AAD7JN01_9AGAR|nr:armadillo-type protein [Mycena metata]